MTRTHANQFPYTLISLVILCSTWHSAVFPYIHAVRKAAKLLNKNFALKSALLIRTVSTNALHSTYLFLFSRHYIPTNSVAPFFSIMTHTHNPQFFRSPSQRANAWNVYFETLRWPIYFINSVC